MPLRFVVPVRLAALSAVAVALLALSAAPTAANQPARDPNVARVEREFLMGMIPHHRGAIRMGELALQKAVLPDLRDMAQSIIRDQNREKDLMAGYLLTWYGAEPPLGMTMPADVMGEMDSMMHGTMPDSMERMRALEAKSGSDFDIEWMSAIIEHHSMAIMMASPVLVSAEHAELYPLAEQIVKAQGDEIKDLLWLLDTRYGVKRPR